MLFRPERSVELLEIFQINCTRETKELEDVVVDINVDHKIILEEIMKNYNPVGRRDVDVTVNLKGRWTHRILRTWRSVAEREIIKEQAEWMRDEIVQPSLSEYASPAGKEEERIDYV